MVPNPGPFSHGSGARPTLQRQPYRSETQLKRAVSPLSQPSYAASVGSHGAPPPPPGISNLQFTAPSPPRSHSPARAGMTVGGLATVGAPRPSSPQPARTAQAASTSSTSWFAPTDSSGPIHSATSGENVAGVASSRTLAEARQLLQAAQHAAQAIQHEQASSKRPSQWPRAAVAASSSPRQYSPPRQDQPPQDDDAQVHWQRTQESVGESWLLDATDDEAAAAAGLANLSGLAPGSPSPIHQQAPRGAAASSPPFASPGLGSSGSSRRTSPGVRVVSKTSPVPTTGDQAGPQPALGDSVSAWRKAAAGPSWDDVMASIDDASSATNRLASASRSPQRQRQHDHPTAQRVLLGELDVQASDASALARTSSPQLAVQPHSPSRSVHFQAHTAPRSAAGAPRRPPSPAGWEAERALSEGSPSSLRQRAHSVQQRLEDEASPFNTAGSAGHNAPCPAVSGAADGFVAAGISGELGDMFDASLGASSEDEDSEEEHNSVHAVYSSGPVFTPQSAPSSAVPPRTVPSPSSSHSARPGPPSTPTRPAPHAQVMRSPVRSAIYSPSLKQAFAPRSPSLPGGTAAAISSRTPIVRDSSPPTKLSFNATNTASAQASVLRDSAVRDVAGSFLPKWQPLVPASGVSTAPPASHQGIMTSPPRPSSTSARAAIVPPQHAPSSRLAPSSVPAAHVSASVAEASPQRGQLYSAGILNTTSAAAAGPTPNGRTAPAVLQASRPGCLTPEPPSASSRARGLPAVPAVLSPPARPGYHTTSSTSSPTANQTPAHGGQRSATASPAVTFAAPGAQARVASASGVQLSTSTHFAASAAGSSVTPASVGARTQSPTRQSLYGSRRASITARGAVYPSSGMSLPANSVAYSPPGVSAPAARPASQQTSPPPSASVSMTVREATNRTVHTSPASQQAAVELHDRQALYRMAARPQAPGASAVGRSKPTQAAHGGAGSTPPSQPKNSVYGGAASAASLRPGNSFPLSSQPAARGLSVDLRAEGARIAANLHSSRQRSAPAVAPTGASSIAFPRGLTPGTAGSSSTPPQPLQMRTATPSATQPAPKTVQVTSPFNRPHIRRDSPYSSVMPPSRPPQPLGMQGTTLSSSATQGGAGGVHAPLHRTRASAYGATTSSTPSRLPLPLSTAVLANSAAAPATTTVTFPPAPPSLLPSTSQFVLRLPSSGGPPPPPHAIQSDSPPPALPSKAGYMSRLSSQQAAPVHVRPVSAVNTRIVQGDSSSSLRDAAGSDSVPSFSSMHSAATVGGASRRDSWQSHSTPAVAYSRPKVHTPSSPASTSQTPAQPPPGGEAAPPSSLPRPRSHTAGEAAPSKASFGSTLARERMSTTTPQRPRTGTWVAPSPAPLASSAVETPRPVSTASRTASPAPQEDAGLEQSRQRLASLKAQLAALDDDAPAQGQADSSAGQDVLGPLPSVSPAVAAYRHRRDSWL